jgi:transglutaminase-like putative cysteine protease
MTLERKMTLTAALAVVLVSTVIFPLFAGALWFYAGIGAVLVVAASGTLSRIRTLPVVLCLAISLAGLLLYLNVAFESSRSFAGFIPTAASLRALGTLFHTGMDEASKYAPGAPDVAGLVFLATGGIGITAVFTDLIAVRLRSAALAGLPLLVLFTVPVSMTTGRSGLETAVIFCLATSGYLAMLSVDGRERIRVWGRLVSLWRSYDGEFRGFNARSMAASQAGPPSPSPNGNYAAAGARARPASTVSSSTSRPPRGPDTRPLAAAGRRVGLASVVLALCAPLLVPGLHAGRLLSSDWGFGNGNGGNGTVTLPDPLSATAAQLRDNRPTNILTYTTTASSPGYLQQYVYDTLTDSNSNPWQLFSNQTTTHPFGTTLPREDGLRVAAPEVTTSIKFAPGITGNPSGINFLPAPFPPVQVTGQHGTWQVDPSTLMLVTKDSSLAGQSYRVVSRNVDPNAAQLRQVRAAEPGSADTQVPPDYGQHALRAIALQHTATAKSQYDKAIALQNWLSDSPDFGYSLDATPIGSAAGLVQFLTKTKSGDCVQYAFAMTVLARLLGMQARLVTGYTQGWQTPPNAYVVKSTDAHAWPEVFFSGYGWLRFEPTPQGQGSARPADYSAPAASNASPPILPAGQPTSLPTGSTGNRSKLNQISNFPNASGGATARKPAANTPWTAILLAVLAAIALACGVIAIAAPAAARAMSSRPDGRRRRGGLGFTAALIAVAVAGVVALALYRLLSRTAGLNLGTGWATVGIAFGAACVFALAIPTACRAVLRRLRWMKARDDASRAHTAWYELQADLADFGVGYLPSESPRALAGRVTTKLALPESAVAAVGRIALAEERATYAARPASSETLRRDSSTARRAIAAASGRGARWRSRIFPASTMSVIVEAGARIAEWWTARTWLRWNPLRARWDADRG